MLIHTRMLENTAQAQVTPQLICILGGPAPMHWTTNPPRCGGKQICCMYHIGVRFAIAMLCNLRPRRWASWA